MKQKLRFVLLIAGLIMLSMTVLPAQAQQVVDPTLVCPSGFTLQESWQGELILLGRPPGPVANFSFNLAQQSDVVVTLWSMVGHPDRGCTVGQDNFYPCDQTDQLNEEFYVDVDAANIAFLPDHGTDQWSFYGDVSVGTLAGGAHSITFRHSQVSINNTAESVGYKAGLCVRVTPPPPPTGNQGCTPGYWKNHLGSWVGYSPSQTVEDVFDVPDSYGFDATPLSGALDGGGGPSATGGARILLRAAVAALLNAANPGVAYPNTTATIIAEVNAALASGNRDAMLSLAALYDFTNNFGCPLN